jgi:hypothetical protein
MVNFKTSIDENRRATRSLTHSLTHSHKGVTYEATVYYYYYYYYHHHHHHYYHYHYYYYRPDERLTYLLTYLLTPRSRVLLEKLTGLQLVKKFPASYGTRWFLTALTNARHLSLS